MAQRELARVSEPESLYASRMQKIAGAIAETKLLLSEWDHDASARENLDRFQYENVLGKASRARSHDLITRSFRRRYLGDPEVLAALVTLARERVPAETFDRILYFLTARSDLLLHDLVVDVLRSRYHGQRREITVDEVVRWLNLQVAAGRTESTWSEATTRKVAQGLLTALRDFGVLAGRAKKQIAPMYLPTAAFAFIAFLLSREGTGGSALLRHVDWQLFFLTPEAVERFFVEAHQERLLHFQAAGSIVRIDFPVQTAEEYARVIAQRAR